MRNNNIIVGKVTGEALLTITIGNEKVVLTQQELSNLIDELNSQLHKKVYNESNLGWSGEFKAIENHGK